MKFIPISTWKKFKQVPHYKKILKILETKPQTVEEITKKYQEIEIKASNTIYQYIRDLQRNDMVIEAGRQFSSDYHSTRVLYSLSAKLFLIDRLGTEIWLNDAGFNVATGLGLMLQHHFKKYPDLEKLREFMHNFDNDIKNSIKNIIQSLQQNKSKKAQKLINDINSFSFLDHLDYFYFLGSFSWALKQGEELSFKSRLMEIFNQDLSPDPVVLIDDFDFIPKIESKEENFTDLIENTSTLLTYINVETSDKFFENYSYRSIFLLLLKGPMTLKEIQENQVFAVKQLIDYDEKWGHYQNLKNLKKKDLKKKKENTLYTYLQDLKKAGLIIEAGKRITPGKPFPEILYTRSSIYVFPSTKPNKLKTSIKDSIQDIKEFNIVMLVMQALKMYLDKKAINEDKLKELFKQYKEEKEKLVKEVINKKTNGQTTNLMAKLTFEQRTLLIDTIKFIEWILNMKDKNIFGKKLENCFI
ncbi:MAG: hypothetical protein ACXAC7_12780 [Candidatus Hodarchaeales archaeon]|jgi:hypothetical protein